MYLATLNNFYSHKYFSFIYSNIYAECIEPDRMANALPCAASDLADEKRGFHGLSYLPEFEWRATYLSWTIHLRGHSLDRRSRLSHHAPRLARHLAQTSHRGSAWTHERGVPGISRDRVQTGSSDAH